MDFIKTKIEGKIQSITMAALLGASISAGVATNAAYAVPAGAAMQFQENRAIQERAQQEMRRPAPSEDDRSVDDINRRPDADDTHDRSDAGSDDIRPDAGEVDRRPDSPGVKKHDTDDHNVVKKQMPDNINK